LTLEEKDQVSSSLALSTASEETTTYIGRYRE